LGFESRPSLIASQSWYSAAAAAATPPSPPPPIATTAAAAAAAPAAAAANITLSIYHATIGFESRPSRIASQI